ncbi:MAG: hypothetical protein AB1782_15635 [Cyanobacteriota bacterium]
MKNIFFITILFTLLIFAGCSTTKETITKQGPNGFNWQFEKGKSLYQEMIVISEPGKNRHTFGNMIKGFVGYMTPADYEKCQKEYIQKNRCPASFYNKNAKFVLIMSDNNNHDAPLQGLKSGDKLTISGQELKLNGIFGQDGQKAKTTGTDKFNFVYANQIKINNNMF